MGCFFTLKCLKNLGVPSVPISIPKSIPNACNGLTGYENLCGDDINKSKDMQRFDKICRAYNLSPNDETTRRQLKPKSLAPQGFFLSHKTQNHPPYAKTYANLQSKTQENLIKNNPCREPNLYGLFFCISFVIYYF